MGRKVRQVPDMLVFSNSKHMTGDRGQAKEWQEKPSWPGLKVQSLSQLMGEAPCR